MTETIITEQIVSELKAIRTDIEFIKEHMVDADSIMTPKEELMLKESLEEYSEGKSVSLDEFEKEMNKENV